MNNPQFLADMENAIAELESVQQIEDGDRWFEYLRQYLAARNLLPGCHVGRNDLINDPIARLEWAIGQLVSMFDAGAMWAINTGLNVARRELDNLQNHLKQEAKS